MLTIIGKVTSLHNEEKLPKGTKLRSVVVKEAKENPNTFKIDFYGDKVALLDKRKVNDLVKIDCAVKGRQFEHDGKILHTHPITGFSCDLF